MLRPSSQLLQLVTTISNYGEEAEQRNNLEGETLKASYGSSTRYRGSKCGLFNSRNPEMILRLIDTRTLLFSQLVSRRWRDVIAASPTLQRHLFFRPILLSTRQECREEHMRSSASGHETTKFSASFQGEHGERKTPRPHMIVENHLLKSLFPPLFTPLEDLYCSRGTSYRYGGAPLVAFHRNYITVDNFVAMLGGALPPSDRRTAAILRNGASWRRMLVSQPPPTIVLHTRPFGDTDYQQDAAPLFTSIHVPGGITMGQLYDTVITVLFDRPGHGDYLPWVGMAPRPARDGHPLTVRLPRGYELWEEDLTSGAAIVVGEEFDEDACWRCQWRFAGVAYLPCDCDHNYRLERKKRLDTMAASFRCEEHEANNSLV